MNEQPSFTVTPARVGFMLALLALLTFAWQVASYVKAQEYRITAIETYAADAKQQNRATLAEIQHLDVTVTELATIIKGGHFAGNDASLRLIPGIGADGAGVGRFSARSQGTGAHPSTRESAKLEISTK